jgi:hypothetical protein
MRGTRHTEEQIIAILKQAEGGLKTAEECRHQGITDATLYRWKAKYGGMEVSDAKKNLLESRLSIIDNPAGSDGFLTLSEQRGTLPCR